jgi:hypothetical protein
MRSEGFSAGRFRPRRNRYAGGQVEYSEMYTHALARLLFAAGLAVGLLASITPAARGATVYVLSSGDAATDDAVVQALASRGHTVVLGVQYSDFNGMQSLAGINTVYLQANFNWGAASMPPAGQQMILNWVLGGGRLVTSEWATYEYSTSFPALGVLLPLEVPSYGSESSTTYRKIISHPTINAGLPDSFNFPLVSYAGTQSWGWARPGAKVYYFSQSGPGVAGLAGWRRGAGSVFSFSSTCGPAQVQDVHFGRLLANVMTAVAPPCFSNCDHSTMPPVLNVDDFTCFINAFASAQSLPHAQQIEHYANCDDSTTSPVLNVDDFTCFINAFAAGCP